jgi:hypothetical protein
MSPLYSVEMTLYHNLNKIVKLCGMSSVTYNKQPPKRDMSGAKILNLLQAYVNALMRY